MTIRKTGALVLTGITLVATSSFALAEAQPDGLYSADQLLDADVYMQGSDKSVGEIDDVILDNNMGVEAFVVETGSTFGLGGKSYVVKPNQLRVETMAGKKATKPEYRITLKAESKELGGYPVYNDAWWNGAQDQASDAWEQTKDSASSAWTRIKEGTSDLVDDTRDAFSNAADNTGNAADDAADKTGDAADDAADKTENVTEDATN